MIILTAALLLLRNWTHRFRYLAILGQWTSFALATTYGAWWSFDGAVNEGMSLGNPWYILSSTLLNVSDPWNYHHNGFIYAVHGLVFFTGYRLLLRRLTARRMLWLQSHCRVCGYDLTGITSVCPECGTALNPQIS